MRPHRKRYRRYGTLAGICPGLSKGKCCPGTGGTQNTPLMRKCVLYRCEGYEVLENHHTSGGFFPVCNFVLCLSGVSPYAMLFSLVFLILNFIPSAELSNDVSSVIQMIRQ